MSNTTGHPDDLMLTFVGDDGERHSPPKHIKRSSSFPPAEQSLLSALQDVEAQNVFLRKTVEELAQVVCVSMSGRIVALKNQSEGCYQLMQEIAKLPTNRHDALSKPLNHITRGMQEHVAVDDAATKAMVEVRDKLLGAGLGGLLTVLDKNFCATAAEQARAQVSEASTSGDTGSGA